MRTRCRAWGGGSAAVAVRRAVLCVIAVAALAPGDHSAFAQTPDFDIPDDKIPRNADGSKMMRFEPPKLTEEESHSAHMPANHKCDGCAAVALRLSEAMEKLRERFASRRHAPEAEIVDAIEAACHSDRFESFGVKTVKGRTRLTGPGMYGENEPGLMQGGGRWPVRLGEMCKELAGELEEVQIYDAHVSHGGLRGLRQLLCEGSGKLDSCRGQQLKDEL